MNYDFSHIFQRVCDWNSAAGNQRFSGADPELERKMLIEEVNETCDAIKRGDATETIDGVCDVLFVLIGTMHKLGISEEQILDNMKSVCDSNFTKFPFTKREDGKVMKNPNFKKPYIKVWS